MQFIHLALKKLYDNDINYVGIFYDEFNNKYNNLDKMTWLLCMWIKLINIITGDSNYFIFIRLVLFIAGLQMNPKDNIEEFKVICKSHLVDNYITNNNNDYIKYIEVLFEEKKELVGDLKLKTRLNNITSNPNDMDEICNDILTIYKKLDNKPLEQTINDLLYFIQSSNLVSGVAFNDIKLISTRFLFDNVNKIDIDNINNELSICRQSSFYSALNDAFDKDKISNDKVRLAHYLGLYYEGQVIKADDDDYHTFDNYDTKEMYNYSINQKKIIYIKIIFDAYGEIIRIINNLIKGNAKEIKDVYMKYYPIIINCSMILKKLDKNMSKDSIYDKLFDDLTISLNEINSNIYIYYYLFTKDKLIRLSRFNYFQIDTNNKYRYAYFSEKEQKGDIFDIVNQPTPDEKNIIDENPQSSELFLLKSGYNHLTLNYGNLTYYNSINDNLTKLKSSPLPPSLYNNLSDFYKYVVIITIKKIIVNVNKNKPDLYNKLMEKVNSTYYNISDNMKKTIMNYTLAKVIEELIKTQISLHINNVVNQTMGEIGKDIDIKDIDIKDIPIKIDLPYINLNNIIAPIEKEDCDFFWLSNNFTNDTLLVKKTCITVKTNIIKILLEHNANPYITNNENINIISQLIKYYNYKPIEVLIQNNISFYNNKKNYSENENICYLNNEMKNNMNKLTLGKTMKELFTSIDEGLYNNVKLLIKANETFGNNILYNLETSFHISSYLILQYLSENLINIDSIKKSNNIDNIFKLIDININDINKNYIFENIDKFKIYNNINNIIAKQKMDEKNKERLKLYKFKLENKITEIIKITKNKFKSILDENTKEIDDKINKISGEIKSIKGNISKIGFLQKTNFNIIDTDIIKRYDTHNKKNNVLLYAWDKMFNEEYSDNYNLIIILILEKQKEELLDLSKFKSFNNDIKSILFSMEQFNNIGLKYFEEDKFTDTNKTLNFINEMLIYITKLVIGNSIETIMRRTLYSYFENNIVNNTNINDRINLILKNKNMNYKDLLDILYDSICPQLVLHSVGIHKNINYKKQHINMDISEIMSNYFDLLNYTEINLDKNIINFFKKEIVNYFSIFVSKTILNWYVNAENIMKYFINNYRSLKTLECLTK
jgi:hypothetical protein